MSVERPGWVKVDDEPGEGYFETVDFTSVTQRVPAIQLLGPLDTTYVESQLAAKVPVVVFRYGGRGVCHVQANPQILKVTNMTRFVHKHAWEHKLMRVPIDPVDHYQGQLVSPFQGEKIEITGTIKGKPFQPTVCFVPSRKS